MFSPPEIFMPSKEAAPYVNGYLGQNSEVDTKPFLSPSWSRMALIITLKNNVVVTNPETKESFEPPKVSLMGVNTAPTFVNYNASYVEYIGADLTPEASYILSGLNMENLVDVYYDASEIWSVDELVESLNEVDKIEERKNLLEEFILSKVDENRIKEVRLFQETYDYVKKSNFCITVGDICKEMSLTEVTLKRLYKKVVGVTPKTFLSLRLFEELMKEKKENSGNLKNVADLAFYDFSHINKWFKKYVGCSPSEFDEKRLDVVESILKV